MQRSASAWGALRSVQSAPQLSSTAGSRSAHALARLQAAKAQGVAVYSYDEFLALGRANPAPPCGCKLLLWQWALSAAACCACATCAARYILRASGFNPAQPSILLWCCAAPPCELDDPCTSITHTLLLLTCTNPHSAYVCAAPPKPEDLCTIMYTSGTTGDPKVSPLAVVLEILRCCCVMLLPLHRRVRWAPAACAARARLET